MELTGKVIGSILAMAFTFSCSSDGGVEPSSSSDMPSSSSISIVPSSSSAPLSSSSAPPSSSSIEPSSSSSDEPSSSSIASSSSSAPPSSSSAPPSSSSAPPSSSSVSLCANFVEGTEREHLGKNKKQFCDERDGKKYVYAKIGEQTWMAENLNYAASGSKCGNGNSLSDNNTASCDTYGRLYTFATATNNSTASSGVRGVCPSGWHLPSDADWNKLFRYADGTSGTENLYSSPTAGRYLKAKEGWNSCGPSGKSYLCEDTHGFSALPGGDGYSKGSFNYVGDYGGWWSAGEYNGRLYHRNMNHNTERAGCSNNEEDGLFSVRCLKD